MLELNVIQILDIIEKTDLNHQFQKHEGISSCYLSKAVISHSFIEKPLTFVMFCSGTSLFSGVDIFPLNIGYI